MAQTVQKLPKLSIIVSFLLDDFRLWRVSSFIWGGFFELFHVDFFSAAGQYPQFLGLKSLDMWKITSMIPPDTTR